MGTLGAAEAKGFRSSNLGITWGRRLKVDVHKTEATSRRSGSTSRRSIGFISQRRDVSLNVTTFHKGEIVMSRHWDQTSRRARESINPTS